MKCGLLSLALLGAPASGCWLRNSVDGRRTEVEGRNWAQDQQALMESLLVADERESLVADEAARNARAKRFAGKRALSKACSDDPHFSECSQDKGSAIRLERCLNATGNKLSASCLTGLQSWKQVLASTAPDARNGKGHGPGSKKALARAARVQEGKVRVAAEQGMEHELSHMWWLTDPELIDLEPELVLAGAGPHHPHHDRVYAVAAEGHTERPPHDHFHFHARAPPGFRVDEDEMLPPEERRPSMFSVLAEWIFGESSDSWESPSSSDDLFDGQGVYIFDAISTSSAADAGLFPAGYAFPLEANGATFEAPQPAQPWNSLRPAKLRARKSLRGRPESEEFEPEEIDAFFAAVELKEEQAWDAYVHMGVLEADYYQPLPEEVTMEEMREMENMEQIEFLTNNEALRNDFLRRSRDNRVGGNIPSVMLAEEDVPMFAGGPHVHPKRHHRGDHIRFRNPLPEGFENQRAWLSDSFDVDGDGPDLVEAILAFFFFIGAMTLMLLPFFFLGRALKRMARNGGGGGGGGSGGDDTDAPDGYYALPEDAASASAASARMAAAEEDKSIVVTGTPVNPPPSVHL